MRKHQLALITFLLVMLSSPQAHAYIGPGAGAGTIAVVLGVLASIVMAFFALLWYPVKRLIKKNKSAKPGDSATAEKTAES